MREATQTMGCRMPSLVSQQISDIQAALAALGYKGRLLPVFRSLQLPAGSKLSLQFADSVLTSAKGRSKLVLDGTLQINADDGPSTGLVRVDVEKIYRLRGERPIDLVLKLKLLIGIEADLHVPGDLEFGRSAIHRAESYSYLQSLVADALQIARNLQIDPCESTLCGPAIRIEARLLADLALGRTGVVRSSKQTASSEFAACTTAACEWLQHRVLPELRSVVGRLSRKDQFMIPDRAALTDSRAPMPQLVLVR